MGLRYVKGLSSTAGESIERARRDAPFVSLEDFVRRTDAGEKALKKLAEAGALDGFGEDRRQALWSVLYLSRACESSLPAQVAETPPEFDKLGTFETIAWDYRTSHHSPRGHPLGPLRAELDARGLPDARKVISMKDGVRVRYAGLVICRQRPSTAGGVVFMTLEDETGFVNLVVWERVFKQHSVIAKTASFLGATGKLQVQDGVVHLVAEKLWIPTFARSPERTRSRDFH
jgi:error-prone DNA polymerase